MAYKYKPKYNWKEVASSSNVDDLVEKKQFYESYRTPAKIEKKDGKFILSRKSLEKDEGY